MTTPLVLDPASGSCHLVAGWVQKALLSGHCIAKGKQRYFINRQSLSVTENFVPGDNEA